MAIEGVLSGRQRKPPRVVLYGQEGIGKSTFGACAPRPIFLPTEDGLGEIDVDRFPLIESYSQFIDCIGKVCESDGDYDTVVVDSLDWLEKLIWSNVCKRFSVPHIEKADGGYARGYKHALTEWKEVLSCLDYCRGKGMAVVAIAHAKAERFEDPETLPYDRWTLRLHKDADALIREWSDAVLFATTRKRTETTDAGFNRQRTIAKALGADGGERIVRTIGSPACVAKNRYGLPAELPLSWAEFEKAMTQQTHQTA